MSSSSRPGSLVYALVSRGPVVLCEYSGCTGNFASIAKRILDRLPLSDQKMTYLYDKYCFHYLVSQGVVFLCMADEGFSKRSAFAFLDDVKGRFLGKHGGEVLSAQQFEFNNSFAAVLKARMEYYESAGSGDAVDSVRGQVDEVKQIMVQNIEKVLDRGDRIELLVEKTDSLNQSAFQFKRKSQQVKRAFWWRNCRINLLIAAVIIVIVGICVLAGCGGWHLPKCVKKQHPGADVDLNGGGENASGQAHPHRTVIPTSAPFAKPSSKPATPTPTLSPSKKPTNATAARS